MSKISKIGALVGAIATIGLALAATPFATIFSLKGLGYLYLAGLTGFFAGYLVAPFIHSNIIAPLFNYYKFVNTSWRKIGDYSSFRIPTPNDYSRRVAYQNIAANEPVHTLTISQYLYQEDKVEVKLQLKNANLYPLLKEKLVQAGFEVPTQLDENTHVIRVKSSCLGFIKRFIDTIQGVIPQLMVIRNDINSSLNINANTDLTVPKWIRDANHDRYYIKNDTLLSLSYLGTSPASSLQSIHIKRCEDSDLKISFTVRDAKKCEELKQCLTTLEIPEEKFVFSQGNSISVKLDDDANIRECLYCLSQFEPDFKVIEEDIFNSFEINELDAENNEDYDEESENEFEELELVSDDEEELELPVSDFESRIEKAKVPQDKIPEEFLCSIMNTVMTRPVYDPIHPETKFDYANIELHLQNYDSNPFTNTPLDMGMLKEDKALQKRIRKFVEDAEKSQEKPKAAILHQHKNSRGSKKAVEHDSESTSDEDIAPAAKKARSKRR